MCSVCINSCVVYALLVRYEQISQCDCSSTPLLIPISHIRIYTLHCLLYTLYCVYDQTAATLGSILFFGTFFPYFYVGGPNEVGVTPKTFASLLVPTALALGGDTFAGKALLSTDCT
jgi:hypothetical protein